MASLDEEEGQIVSVCVNNYYMENDKHEPVSLTSLPLLWSLSEIKIGLETNVFLRGTSDDGLQRIFKHIIAWRFELSYAQPEISVLSKDKNWITLQRPRKSFQRTIRTVLVTVYWLHFVKSNPGQSRISVWNYMQKAFSSFDVEPSENDILNHVLMVREAAERDKDLKKSQYLLNLIEKPCSNNVFEGVQTAKKSKFIVDSDEEVEHSSGDEFDENGGFEIGSYDTVCAICDNGGEILPCEGRCLRSFHASKDAGIDTFCESLGYSTAQVKAIPKFYCENCKYKQHQCFACGKLDSSDMSSDAEVFICISGNCGYYYHPECVARLLCPGNGTEQEEKRKRVAAGEAFLCPVHRCSLCGKGENKDVPDLQLAMCRRCPKTYHRKCLPKEIAFASDYDKGIDQRAWEGLLDRRILIYCMDHEIIKELGTPLRNHLKFPDMRGKKKWPDNLPFVKETVAASQKSLEILATKTKSLPNQVTKASGSMERVGPTNTKIVEKRSFGQDMSFSANSTKSDTARKLLNIEKSSVSCRSLTTTDNKLSLRNDKSSYSSGLQAARSQHPKLTGRKTEKTIMESAVGTKAKIPVPIVDADMERRILHLMKESTLTFNEEEFKKGHQVSSTNSCCSGIVFDKNFTDGKVEASVKAIQTALKKLEEGCSIEDAQVICDRGMLNQMFIWQKKLKVYLAPFLHGMRYTSFGRHFTKIDKLKEIVDRLHFYVQNGDTIVDFCCGSNDFSCLMKAKLEQMGKSCSFKNYDLFQAKNDFSFEKRDWISVNVEELPNGSQLIMGLNPPFGVNGSLANKFINKALTFKPKLLILIVPKVTKRLDRKKGGYDLIWEDAEVLSGKSFYLPGSVDTHDKQMEDWNVRPPPLYLWSRPDWTSRHFEIALKHGHIKEEQIPMHLKGNYVKNYLMEENYDCYQDYSDVHAAGDYANIFDGIPEDNGEIMLEEGTSSVDKLKDTLLPDFGKDLKTEALPYGNWDMSLIEANGMSVDMDLSG